MKILIVTPAPPRSRKGNRITALRWQRLLRELGHRVALAEEYDNQACHLLVALHARKSYPSVARFRRARPEAPLVLALTGTDLYGDIHRSAQARRSLELADRLVVLQPAGIEELPEHLRGKARVIYQSAQPPRRRPKRREDVFLATVVGHLRPVKDPLRTAKAARLLPAESRVQVVHLGAALSESLARQARAEEAANPRYRWLGEVPRGKVLQWISRSRLLVLTSKLEGGANAISEALACQVPVISSRISGSIGLLGPDYPGYFPVGDTRALAELLRRAESDQKFYAALERACRRQAGRLSPEGERRAWQQLLRELLPKGGK